MIVAVCSLSGAPGVTSLAVALAACWPASPVTVPVIVEADASGGDIAAWHGLEGAPRTGLVALAAASRTPALVPREETAQAPLDVLSGEEQANPAPARFAMEVPGGLRVVAAPGDPLEAGHAVAVLAQNPALLASGRATVVDVGRAVPGSAGAALLRHADLVLVVTAPGGIGQAARLRACAPVLASLREDGTRVGLVVTGNCPHPDAEVSRIAADLPVWARIPHDPVGAALVRGEHRPPVRWRDRFAAWSAHRRDPDCLEWMPLIKAAKGLAELCDDFSGVGLDTLGPELAKACAA
ncbi:hypothetical protein [Nocardiopsis sp. CC223A]|uniref:hypothetical protein n=1 Tax=Nocardiopsis sp. CC223A TaxID=3044051 RepID=UPI00278C1F67|nr:hypothetical protein [Nocardiopsis sp. CC223A]